MKAQNRWSVVSALGLALAVTGTVGQESAQAQDFPTKPIQIVVPYPAGGTTDQLARALQPGLSETLGQPIVIQNRPGAGGTIGTDYVVRSQPDGYTLVFGNTGPNAIVSLVREIPYDPVQDLQPISTVALTPMILAVPTESPAQSLEEFFEYARTPGRELNYGSTGNGGISHLAGEHFNRLAGTSLLHIPYAGAAPMLPAFGGGELHAAFLTGLDGTVMVNSGRVRYLAVATLEPSEVTPGLPAIAEALPGFEVVPWFGLLGPKGIPADITAKLSEAVAHAVSQPEIQAMFRERWIEPRASTPEELAERIQDEQSQWAPLIKEAGIQG